MSIKSPMIDPTETYLKVTTMTGLLHSMLLRTSAPPSKYHSEPEPRSPPLDQDSDIEDDIHQ